jgi:YNFM family putative membrane transporter
MINGAPILRNQPGTGRTKAADGTSSDTRGAAGGVGAFVRGAVIALTAFSTTVDLFATQALVPSLAAAYGVSPSSMGVAVNASTLGMAVAGLLVAPLGRSVERRQGILGSLALLAVPTALLSAAPNLTIFTALRVTQGLFMSTAFALTLAYLGEQCSAKSAAGAFAAYITGNVASNLFGRLLAATITDLFGLTTCFYVFAALNLSGALLVYFAIRPVTSRPRAEPSNSSVVEIWTRHLRNERLQATFIVGFFILFAFTGTFTYVNFVLVAEPFSIGMTSLGCVYFVFVPAILTTLLAGRAVHILGSRRALWSGIVTAGIGLPLLLSPKLAVVLVGLAFVGSGTFFAQAVATGYISKAARIDRAAASGMYLACYFIGGLVGSAVLGQLFVRYGWPSSVVGLGVSLALAGGFGLRLSDAEHGSGWKVGQHR